MSLYNSILFLIVSLFSYSLFFYFQLNSFELHSCILLFILLYRDEIDPPLTKKEISKQREREKKWRKMFDHWDSLVVRHFEKVKA